MEAVEGVEDGGLNGRMGEVAQMAALLEQGDLAGGKGGLEPGEVSGGQEKIVTVEDQPDVGVGVEAVAVGAEVAGFFERVGRGEVDAAGLVVGNDKFLEVILIRVLEDFLIYGFAPPVPDGMPEDFLVVPRLAAEDDVAQDEAE